MENEEMAELATLERLIKERNHLTDLLELIQSGDIEKAMKILNRDIESINEAIKEK